MGTGINRRQFLQVSGFSLSAAGLALVLCAPSARATAEAGRPRDRLRTRPRVAAGGAGTDRPLVVARRVAGAHRHRSLRSRSSRPRARRRRIDPRPGCHLPRSSRQPIAASRHRAAVSLAVHRVHAKRQDDLPDDAHAIGGHRAQLPAQPRPLRRRPRYRRPRRRRGGTARDRRLRRSEPATQPRSARRPRRPRSLRDHRRADGSATDARGGGHPPLRHGARLPPDLTSLLRRA